MTLRTAALTMIGKSLNAACVCVIIVQLTAPGHAACRANPHQASIILLAACRPNPVTPPEKAALRASLPAMGEVLITGARDVEKTDSIRRILHVLGRDAIYDVKVVDVPEAWAGLYGRAVLLISLPMFRLLGKEELAAIAAHEAGHEFVWKAFEEARTGNDKAALRHLELTADAIAAIALTRVGIPADRLISGLERASTYNLTRFGFSRNQESYPSLNERRRVALGAARRLEVGAEITSGKGGED